MLTQWPNKVGSQLYGHYQPPYPTTGNCRACEQALGKPSGQNRLRLVWAIPKGSGEQFFLHVRCYAERYTLKGHLRKAFQPELPGTIAAMLVDWKQLTVGPRDILLVTLKQLDPREAFDEQYKALSAIAPIAQALGVPAMVQVEGLGSVEQVPETEMLDYGWVKLDQVMRFVDEHPAQDASGFDWSLFRHLVASGQVPETITG